MSTFPNVKLGLMVGIGGGAPSPSNDIRLGDVVVGLAYGPHGGVVHYDHIRREEGGIAYQTGHVNRPPNVFATTAARLKARHVLEGHQFEEDMARRLEGKRTAFRQACAKPSKDRLARSDVIHADQERCSVCSPVDGVGADLLVQRAVRDKDEDDPAIHYGLIASGEQLVKDVKFRDKMALEQNVLCFEMEAAGLANDFPCLVIRGITDYADSHKNHQWHGYASMAAAAYATALLQEMNKVEIVPLQDIRALLGNVEAVMERTEQTMTGLARKADDISRSETHRRLLAWLKPPDSHADQQSAASKRHPGTGDWLQTDGVIQSWLTSKNGLLWLRGSSGCGKTVLVSTIVDHLLSLADDSIVCYYYFSFTDKAKQDQQGMLKQIAFQIHCQHAPGETALARLRDRSRGLHLPPTDALIQSITDMLRPEQSYIFILDALDESNERNEIIAFLNNIRAVEHRYVKVLLSAQPRPDIGVALSSTSAASTVMYDLPDEAIMHDIRSYVEATLTNDIDLKTRWAEYPDIQRDILNSITSKADKMFRFAACALDEVKQCVNGRSVRDTLTALPATIDQIYTRAVGRVPMRFKAQFITVLQLIIWAQRPLTAAEAIQAAAVDENGTGRLEPLLIWPCPEDLMNLCPILIAATSAQEGRRVLQLSHSSVRDYLLSKASIPWAGCAFSESDASDTLTRICLGYAASVPQDEDMWKPATFSNYAWMNWVAHAKLTNRCGYDMTMQLTEFFASETETFTSARRTLPYCADKYHWTHFLQQLADTAHFDTRPLPHGYLAPFFCAVGLWGCFQAIVDAGYGIVRSFGGIDNIMFIANKLNDKAVSSRLMQTATGESASAGATQASLLDAIDHGDPQYLTQCLETSGPYYSKDILTSALKITVERQIHCDDQITQLAIIRQLVSHGALIDYAAGPGLTALELALEHRHTRVFRALLDLGTDSNESHPDEGVTMLQCAVWRNRKQETRLLLDAGANVDKVNPADACPSSMTRSWQRLLDDNSDSFSNTADLHMAWSIYAYTATALQTACVDGYSDMVDLLLDRNADINLRAGIFGTALHVAALQGNRDLVAHLIARGADVNARSDAVGTPSQAALWAGHAELHTYLKDLSDGSEIPQSSLFCSPKSTREELGESARIYDAPSIYLSCEDAGFRNYFLGDPVSNMTPELSQPLLDTGQASTIGATVHRHHREAHWEIVGEPASQDEHDFW